MFGEAFVVVVEASAAHDPGERALDDPAARQHLEGADARGLADDLDGDLEQSLGPGDELAGTAAAARSCGDATSSIRGNGRPPASPPTHESSRVATKRSSLHARTADSADLALRLRHRDGEAPGG